MKVRRLLQLHRIEVVINRTIVWKVERRVVGRAARLADVIREEALQRIHVIRTLPQEQGKHRLAQNSGGGARALRLS